MEKDNTGMAQITRRRFPGGCVVGIFILCIGLTGIFVLVEQIPDLAEKEFGVSNPQLSWFDRIHYSLQILAARERLSTPVDPNGQPQNFTIGVGESVNSIILRLEQSGLIQDGVSFRYFMIYSGLDTGIQAGEYELNPAWTAVEIGQRLQDSTPSEVRFIILAGWRLEEIAGALPTSGLNITPTEFLRAARNPPPAWLPPGLGLIQNLEGYLLPGEYLLPRDTDLRNFVQVLTARFDERVGEDLRSAFDRQGLSLSQAVILASIVQREGVVAEEQPMIASVFLNRLAIGMKLDADPTVQYAVGFNPSQNTWWTNPISRADLGFDSPYNTYLYSGLPPGPICMPSMTALQAVAYPAQSPYYYFRALCDGSNRHLFAVTYEEHLGNACP
jgi:UPF0755 protein